MAIDSLRFSSKKRRGVSPKRVDQLRQALEYGESMMPIRVNALGDGTYVVKDGRHRIQAHLEAGIDHIYAFVDNLSRRIRSFFSLYQRRLRSAFLLTFTINVVILTLARSLSYRRLTLNIKMLGILLLFILPTASIGSGFSRFRILRHQEFVFENTDCERTHSCSLKKVKYIVEDFTYDGHYQTRFFAHYETQKVSDLEEYVFVQFLKGCAYAVDLNESKDNIYGEILQHFGQQKTFNFSNWMIDSDWSDPVYSSQVGEASRHFGCRWNLLQGDTSSKTEKQYKEGPPSFPEYYIYDRPGDARVVSGFAHNTSLQFKTCIYKTSDVPTKITPDNLDFAPPISCYEWDSSFIYNPIKKRYERRSKISRICKQLGEGPAPSILFE